MIPQKCMQLAQYENVLAATQNHEFAGIVDGVQRHSSVDHRHFLAYVLRAALRPLGFRCVFVVFPVSLNRRTNTRRHQVKSMAKIQIYHSICPKMENRVFSPKMDENVN